MSKTNFRKYFLCLGFFFLLFAPSSFLYAQPMPPAESPHEMPGVENTGEVSGNLFTQNEKGEKTPVSGQVVSLLVFNNNQQVLMLEKTTNQNGHFHFKNIFRDPAFSYGLGIMYHEELFIFPRFQLEKNEIVKKIEFWVGPGSPYQRDLESMMKQKTPAAKSPMEPPVSPNHISQNSFTNWQKFFQGFAILLLCLTVMFAAYFLGKRAKK